MDMETNRVSCINIIDSIEVRSFPTLIPNFNILCIFDKEKEDAMKNNCNINLNLNGQELMKKPIEVDFTNAEIGFRSMFEINNLLLPVNGELNVEITDKESAKIANWHIKVDKENDELS